MNSVDMSALFYILNALKLMYFQTINLFVKLGWD